jgi:hypothetical protein
VDTPDDLHRVEDMESHTPHDFVPDMKVTAQ